jgi:hypothetical protein
VAARTGLEPTRPTTMRLIDALRSLLGRERRTLHAATPRTFVRARVSPQLGALVVKYAPIIVLVILALGIIAVTIYRPHGSSRVNSIGTSSEFASSCSSPTRCLLTTVALEEA